MPSKNEQVGADEFLATLLAPCICEEPTAGAVIIVSTDVGASYTTLNMSPLEAVHVLRGAAMLIESKLGGNMEQMQ